MERFDSQYGPYALTIWSERTPKPRSSQDAWLISERDEGLRLAVIDGCTPMEISPGRVGIDGGIWAAAVIGAALRAWSPAEQCLLEANALLCDEHIEISQARNQAAVIVADLHAGGVHLCRAMDCEAWLQTDAGEWQPLFPRDRLKEEPLAAYESWKQANPQAGSEEMQHFEEGLLGKIESWNTTAVGRYPTPIFEQLQISPVPRQLVLASDGARLTAERLDDLDGWMAELRDWERRTLGEVAGGKPHDDVTVLRLQNSR